jgi:hypothetical protein
LKCHGTNAETSFCFLFKQTSPFKSAGASVQSTTGSQGVCISGSNAEYTMFRGSVKGTGYPLHSPVSCSLPLPHVTVCHHISTGLYLHLQCWNAGKSLLQYMASHPNLACSFEKLCMGLLLMNCYYALLSLNYWAINHGWENGLEVHLQKLRQVTYRKITYSILCSAFTLFKMYIHSQYMRSWSDKCTVPILGSLYSSVIRSVQISLYCYPSAYIVLATIEAIEAFLFFCPLVISVHVLHYQSSCHKCLHFMTFKIVAAKILFQYWMQIITWWEIPLDTITL